jgi:cyclin-C
MSGIERGSYELFLFRFIINDTYRSDLCLIHPPHIIAIAALYVAIITHEDTKCTVLPQLSKRLGGSSAPAQPSNTTSTPTPSATGVRRSSRHANQTQTQSQSLPEPKRKVHKDPIDFLAGLNVSVPLIATVIQEILSLYALWARYKEDSAAQGSSSSTNSQTWAPSPYGSIGSASAGVSPLKRSAPGSSAGTPSSGADVGEDNGNGTSEGGNGGNGWGEAEIVTPSMLGALLLRMRETKMLDLAHPDSGRPQVAVNKVLERAQAASR